jgi:hypothetical protein
LEQVSTLAVLEPSKKFEAGLFPNFEREIYIRVRVGKEALSEGLDFAKVGKLFLDKYHENPHIQAVKLIFVTLPEFDYKSLGTLATHCESITGTIDHIFKNVMMDCKSCSLQQVCDEVEGLRELHFASMKEGSR